MNCIFQDCYCRNYFTTMCLPCCGCNLHEDIQPNHSFLHACIQIWLDDLYLFCVTFCSLLFSLFICELHLKLNVRGRSQTTLTRFWLFFDHLPPFVYTFYLIKFDIFWLVSTYPPLVVNVFCELISYTMIFFAFRTARLHKNISWDFQKV